MSTHDHLNEVRPKGWLGEMLRRIENPRRHRWGVYLRRCRMVPKGSPVHGCTDFKKLNERRCQLINRASTSGRWDELDAMPEFIALQKATSAWLCGPMVARAFLLHRLLLRLERQ